MYYGNNEIDKVYYGGAEIDKIYHGSDLVYSSSLSPLAATFEWGGMQSGPTVNPYAPADPNNVLYTDISNWTVININSAQTVKIGASTLDWSDNVAVDQCCQGESTPTRQVYYGTIFSSQNENRVYVDQSVLNLEGAEPIFSLTKTASVDVSDRSKLSGDRCAYLGGQVLYGYQDSSTKTYKLYLGNTLLHTFTKQFFGRFWNESETSVLVYTGEGLFRVTADGVTKLGYASGTPGWFDGTYIYQNNYDALLKKVDPTTGNVIWATEAKSGGAKILGSYKGYVYVISYPYSGDEGNTELIRIDESTGAITGTMVVPMDNAPRSITMVSGFEFPIASTNGYFGVAFLSNYGATPYNMWLLMKV